MIDFRNFIYQGFLNCCIVLLIFFYSPFRIYSDEINWVEVSKTNNEFLSINPNSIKYNNKGFLSVIAMYSEIDPNDLSVINNQTFLMAIDCEKRLFSKLPVNGEPNQVKNWINPTNDRLIKKTIVNSCSY